MVAKFPRTKSAIRLVQEKADEQADNSRLPRLVGVDCEKRVPRAHSWRPVEENSELSCPCYMLGHLSDSTTTTWRPPGLPREIHPG